MVHGRNFGEVAAHLSDAAAKLENKSELIRERVVSPVKKYTVDILTGGERLQGEWEPKPDKDSLAYWTLTRDLYQENHGRCWWYVFWVLLVNGLTAIFIKCKLPNVDVQ
jgi:hypothetical protein